MSHDFTGEQRPGDFRIICDFSGFKGWASDSVMTWDGYRALRRFAGQEVQRHPQDFVRGRKEDVTVKNARPEAEDVFLEVGEVTAADL